MVAAAPRMDPRLRRLACRLGRRRLATADVHRAVGGYASRIGVPRPSYEQVRLLVNEARIQYAARRVAAELILDVELGRRRVTDLLYLLEE
jgi:hypothetical protein